MHSLTHSTCHYRSTKREGEQSMLYHWYRVLDFGPDFFWRAVEGLHCLPKWKIISVNVKSCNTCRNKMCYVLVFPILTFSLLRVAKFKSEKFKSLLYERHFVIKTLLNSFPLNGHRFCFIHRLTTLNHTNTFRPCCT